MISYANMKLKPVTSTHKFEWNGNEIEVLDYLPVEDKYDLIMVTLQKSFEDGYYNPIKVDEFFHLHLIYMYTNINFTDKKIIDFGFNTLKFHRIEAKYIVGNDASLAVMNKCGLSYEGTARGSMLIKGAYRDIGTCAIIK